MPDAVETIGLIFRQAANAVAQQQLIEIHAVQIVEHAPVDLAGAHALHGRLLERAPIVGEGRPIEIDVLGAAQFLAVSDNGRMPIDDRAEDVEGQRADAVKA